MKSDAEEAFAESWKHFGLQGGEPVREFKFHPTRRWRFDFAWPSQKVALEIDGRGRHQTIAGVRGDCEKYNAAVAMGWRVLRFPATDKRCARDWVELAAELICGVVK